MTCCSIRFPGERTGEAAHRLLQLFHKCGGETQMQHECACATAVSAVSLCEVECLVFQIKKIMKANEKITSDADPMWYLK